VAKRQLKIKLNKDIVVQITLVFAIAVLIYLMIPYFAQIEELHSVINSKKAELEYTLAKNSDIGWINSQSAEIQEKILTIDNLYINKSEGLDFIAEIENLALSFGLSEPQKNIDDKEVTKEVTPITLQLTVNGDWQQIMQYINSLEKMEMIVDISDVKILSKKIDGNEQASIQAQLLTTTYWVI